MASNDKRTFNLPNFPTQKIITGDFGCKGNGDWFGVTDVNHPNNAGQMYRYSGGSDIVGVQSVASGQGVAVTTNTANSGIITDTSNFVSINTCIKY